MLGRASRSSPQFISSSDGSWLGMSACIERMTQMSSIMLGRAGEDLADLDAASTKASTGERTHARFLTVGNLTGRSAANAQWPVPEPAAVLTAAAAAVAEVEESP